jgi:hypothetical protein
MNSIIGSNACRAAIMAALVAGGPLLVPGSASMASAAETSAVACGLPTGQPNAVTPAGKTFSYGGRLIELRYSPVTRCAWGRIQRGRVGDNIWVDWAADMNSARQGRFQGLLGYNWVRSGSTAFTTMAYGDAGHVMRACTNLGSANNAAICTSWY